MRHGESETNAGSLVTGATNVALTRRGKRQARYVGTKLAGHYDLVFTSTLLRSMQTADIAIKAGKVQVDGLERTPSLNERELGDLELRPSRPIPDYANGNFLYAPPGGESYSAVTGRLLIFFAELAKLICSEWALGGRKIERVLICTHMGPMRVLAGILNEDDDPALVLARSFKPAHLMKFAWTKLSYPPFHASIPE
jgi:broad specificity phosphatase PhoE